MNEPMLHVLMDAIDDDLLEEAQRPLPVRRPARRWGTLAACLCIAAALLVWQPWHTAGEAGTDSAAPTVDAALFAPTADTAARLSATLALPADAQQLTDYDTLLDDSGAISAVSCTVAVDGCDYDYAAVYTAEPLPAPDGAQPSESWQVGSLTLLLYGGGAVGWYDGGAGIQWYCVAQSGGAPLVTAFTLMDAQSYTVPSPPEGAEVLDYDLFELDGMTVTEVSFRSDGLTWRYRMAPTDDVTDRIPDLSGLTGGDRTAQCSVQWCSAALRWTEGGAGAVIWKDVAPGLAYSLTVDTGAAEPLLADMARRVFVPAQGDVG